MTELERGTPTSRHIRPELLLSFGLIFPERSQVLRAYYQDVDDRRRRRAGEFEDELLNAAQRSPDEIINLILNDERAGELFERGVQAALLTADERHRRALARAVASGLLANDEAEVNQRQFIFDALASLAEPHIHVLIQIAQPWVSRAGTPRRRENGQPSQSITIFRSVSPGVPCGDAAQA